MDEDFFSGISKKFSGLDAAFAGIGLLWLAGMLFTIGSMTPYDLIVLIPVWSGFAGLYWITKKSKIKSNWKSITLVVVALLFWKSAVAVGVSMSLS